MTELELQMQVADYLRLQYPGVLFHSDFGSGIRLTPGQAVKQKRLQGGRRAWPDMFIAQPAQHSQEYPDACYKFGLFLELKRPGVKIYKKNGDLVANEHIREQAGVLEMLRNRGYVAERSASGYKNALHTREWQLC